MRFAPKRRSPHPANTRPPRRFFHDRVLQRASTPNERDDALAHRIPEWSVEVARQTRATPGTHAFAGPIAVLTDAACASSCETTVKLLRAHPRTRVFGEPTAGHTQFGDIGTFSLPNSRIRIVLPTGFEELASGLLGRGGLRPDVPTPGADAMVAALAWLTPS